MKHDFESGVFVDRRYTVPSLSGTQPTRHNAPQKDRMLPIDFSISLPNCLDKGRVFDEDEPGCAVSCFGNTRPQTSSLSNLIQLY
jgi:hypothetical protein